MYRFFICSNFSLFQIVMDYIESDFLLLSECFLSLLLFVLLNYPYFANTLINELMNNSNNWGR